MRPKNKTKPSELPPKCRVCGRPATGVTMQIYEGMPASGIEVCSHECAAEVCSAFQKAFDYWARDNW